MEREHGIARINNNIGRIDTEKTPRPVKFAPESFSKKITNGSRVVFKRARPGGDWATEVSLAGEVDYLVEMAQPAAGLTRSASIFVLGRAAKMVAEAQAAPTPEDLAMHMDFAEERMANISGLKPTGGSRVGIALVRKAFE